MQKEGENFYPDEIPTRPKYQQPYNIPPIFPDNPIFDWHLRLKIHVAEKHRAKKSKNYEDD